MNRRHFIGGAAAGTVALMLWQFDSGRAEAAYPFTLSDAEWRAKLSPWAYKVLRQQATEYPYSSPLNKEHRAGIFSCAGCAQKLFDAKTKFDSGTGWPSFWAPLPRAVGTSRDFDLGYPRTEVHCARCGGHLGHVFDDGPKPTGKRYCMNGVALVFTPA
ncbi:peptide-methionine (R)-S-oxide reductase MsrB [Sphingobium ummariense]